MDGLFPGQNRRNRADIDCDCGQNSAIGCDRQAAVIWIPGANHFLIEENGPHKPNFEGVSGQVFFKRKRIECPEDAVHPMNDTSSGQRSTSKRLIDMDRVVVARKAGEIKLITKGKSSGR